MGQSGGEVFAILAREHEQGLLAYVRSCVFDPAAADDIVQESLITAWRRLSEYDRQRPFAAWLRGIARNKILEHLRNSATAKHHVARLTPDLLDRIGEQQDRMLTADSVVFADRVAPLRSCVSQLPSEDRAILDHHYAQKRSCAVIAQELGLHFETVKKRLQRIREVVRLCILGKLAREATRG